MTTPLPLAPLSPHPRTERRAEEGGDYRAFLASKRLESAPVGFDIPLDAINPMLFPFQRAIVQWALRRGRAALFEACGLGKSFQQIEWARIVSEQTGDRVLILAPLAVSQQTVREARKLGVTLTLCRHQSDVRDGINITNYEMLEHFDCSSFSGVVLDECFAQGTLIDTPHGQTPIETIGEGDDIMNASGVDNVSDIHRREVPYAVRVTAHGRAIISSPNHPYFTQRGWVGAQDLMPGDRCCTTVEAVRMVRNARHAQSLSQWHRVLSLSQEKVLQSILFSEMADETAAIHREGAYARSGGETGSEETRVVRVGQSEGVSGNRTNARSQSPMRSACARENLPHIESDAPRTFRAWGQRTWFDGASADLTGCTRTDLDGGVCFVTGTTDSRLSDALQDRLSRMRAANRYRSGWVFPQFPPTVGPQERCEVGFARVDRLEILQPGHPDLESLRDADGKLYFYDLGGTRHPSFSVNGLLVHNSGILKSYMGSTKRRLIEAFAQTPYRLCCTATPAPNDHTELGNHSEFLGVMPSNEMLSRWFINDTKRTGVYRLKKHAQEDFWDWVASWGIALELPSDIGGSDDGFILPELRLHHLTVDVDLTDPTGEQLFRTPTMSATTLHREMRLTAAVRAAKVAELVAGATEPWLIFCHTNYEADELLTRIPGVVDLRGSEPVTVKEQKILGFLDGSIQILQSKGSILGFGLNLQHCHNVAFVGLSYSFEELYQSIRRVYRYGQAHPVDVYLVAAQTEGVIHSRLQEKMDAHRAMVDAMRASTAKQLHQANLSLVSYTPTRQMERPPWLTSVI